MVRVLSIECACEGLLTVNGQFCGPLERDGQIFPMGKYAQAYIHFCAYHSQIKPLAAVLELRDGQIERLEPKDRCFALVWPDGIVQLELRPEGCEEWMTQREETAAPNTLLRYLSLEMAGDVRAKQLLMRAQDGILLTNYEAALPLRFAPLRAPAWADECAGLVRRTGSNTAAVDAAVAAVVPCGQGKRMVERIEIIRT